MDISGLKRILLFDDDAGNNLISKIFLRKIFPSVETIAFADPEKGLEYIANEYTDSPAQTIILLDINMPHLSGWDVVERFANFDDQVKKHFTIYILSSSINPDDKRRAEDTPLIDHFIEKPLTVEQWHHVLIEENN